MKTAEEIKKGLAEAIEEASWVVEGGDAHDLIEAVEKAHASMADAYACIQQLEMLAKPNEQVRWERDVAIDQLKQLGVGFGEKVEAQIPKWISVEERLPRGSNGFDFCVMVIVYTQDEQVTTGWNNNGEWYLLNWDNDFISKHPAEYVTHWMPLPEGPKEG